MDPSAPKRRKTSPTESVPVESTTSPGPPPPPQQQQAEQAQPSEPHPSSPSRSPQIPSSTTPTKSTLAITNPETLALRQETALRRSDELPASEPTSQEKHGDVDTSLTAQSEHDSEGGATASSPSPAGHEPRATAPGAQNLPRSPTRRVGGTTLGAQPPHRTPSRPQPRPLPPPGPDDEEDILNPFVGRVLRRSPMNTGVLPVIVREEPELPPTPQHPDPVVSTPPSGIHNTPSKRRRVDVERGTAAAREASSPTKHPLSQDVQLGKPQKETQKVKSTRVAQRGSPIRTVEQVVPLLQQPEEITEAPKKKFAPGTHPRRSVRLRGPNWEKVQQRDALLQEVAQLEKDLELARGENRVVSSSGRIIDTEDILDLFRRHLLPAEKEPEPGPSLNWLEAAMDPIAMLGFDGRSTFDLPPAILQQEVKGEEQRPIISHHPIQMTASEELPYLQVFTPLTFTSTMTTSSPHPSVPKQATLQRYKINVRSASPSGLFAGSVEVTVNTRNQAIVNLAVPRLDPVAAAELKPFIDSTLPPSNLYENPPLRQNASVVFFAMGEWYRVALKRAKFWHVLDKELGPESKDDLVKMVTTMRLRKKRRRKAREPDETDDAVGGRYESPDSMGSLDSMMLSKGDLLPHMGRTSMDLEVPYLHGNGEKSEVRMSWHVEFDWTGQARSKLGVEVGVPGNWQAMDERKSIVGIPTLFDKLLQGGEDPLTAIKTVVALLAGEPES